MTGGGQIWVNRTDKKDKRSFGFNAQGQAQSPAGSPGGPKGHFDYVNHNTGVKIHGPVTFIFYAFPTTSGGEMRFEVTARQHDKDANRPHDENDPDNDCVHYCKYNVTARDRVDPGSKSPYDTLKVEYVSGSCPVENTGDQNLSEGNIQWHNQ